MLLRAGSALRRHSRTLAQASVDSLMHYDTDGYTLNMPMTALSETCDQAPGGPSTRSRRWLAAAVVLALLISGAGAFAATRIVRSGVLSGSPAPRENDVALRALFPPLQIGHATHLADHEGRSLFGAHTASRGYCFSATSPVDPRGEGGHCVTSAEAHALATGKTVAFAMSGWSVGGYAPGATSVRVSGAGTDLTFPVSNNGWWLGSVEMLRKTLPDQTDGTLVVATSTADNGTIVGSDPLMRVGVAQASDGRVIGVGFASI